MIYSGRRIDALVTRAMCWVPGLVVGVGFQVVMRSSGVSLPSNIMPGLRSAIPVCCRRVNWLPRLWSGSEHLVSTRMAQDSSCGERNTWRLTQVPLARIVPSPSRPRAVPAVASRGAVGICVHILRQLSNAPRRGLVRTAKPPHKQVSCKWAPTIFRGGECWRGPCSLSLRLRRLRSRPHQRGRRCCSMPADGESSTPRTTTTSGIRPRSPRS